MDPIEKLKRDLDTFDKFKQPFVCEYSAELLKLFSKIKSKHVTRYVEVLNKKKDMTKNQILRYYDMHRALVEFIIDNSNIEFKEENTITPRDYQMDIIDKSIDFFEDNDKGLLVFPCGAGKTLISLWIAQKTKSKKIMIAVPKIMLIEQWIKSISMVFCDIPIFVVSADSQTKITKEPIQDFISANENCIVITTYSSVYKVRDATKSTKYNFDIKILDEAHHLTAKSILKGEKTYTKALKVKSSKQLSLTATLKNIDGDSQEIISNGDPNIFGNIIDKKNLSWAIKKDIVCDYDILVLSMEDYIREKHFGSFNISGEDEQRLFLSAYLTLKSISLGYIHHTLIYSNNTTNSKKLITYIEILLKHGYFKFSHDELFLSHYTGEMNKKIQEDVIKKFDNAKYGIITCVYCLGEGWDFPKLNGVVFSENMGSEIRIAQSALRGSRKYKPEPNKISHIILPLFFWNLDDSADMKKVRTVINQLGEEDEDVIQKIKVYTVEFQKCNSNVGDKDGEKEPIGIFNDKLAKDLEVKQLDKRELKMTFSRMKKLIADKKIKSKREYESLCEIDRRFPVEPDVEFKNQFTNWTDYLGICGSFYDLEECKKMVDGYLESYPHLKEEYIELSNICEELCSIDDKFPPCDLWTDYYKINDLSLIIVIEPNKTNKTNKPVGCIDF